MPSLRDMIAGPWRAVLVLGVTEILAWGAIFYPPVLTVPLIADARGWSMSFAMGGFSLALLTAGLVSPRIGWLIGRHGGHRVMPIGSLLAALGLALLVYAAHPAAYLAVWALLGVATAATLYDPAFATLGRIFGLAARRPITVLTLAGGFASTVSWPVTHLLLEPGGGQAPYPSLPRCPPWSQRRWTPLFCRPAAPFLFRRPTNRPKRRSLSCRLPAGRSCWWRRRLRPTPSCRRGYPRICLQS